MGQSFLRDTVYGAAHLLAVVAVASLLIPTFTPGAVADSSPGQPQQFYGTVLVDNVTAPAGSAVSARIAGVQVAAAITDSQGRYGYLPQLFINCCTASMIIDFYVNGVKAAQTAAYAPGEITRLDLSITTQPVTQLFTVNMLSRTDNFSLAGGLLTSAREFASADGRVRLNLQSGTAINLQGQSMLIAASESNPPAAADNTTAVRAYAFLPAGATFSPPATLTLKYETGWLAAGCNEATLYIAFWNGSSWQSLPSTINTTLKELSAPVAHFTVFAIRHPQVQTPTPPVTPVIPIVPITPVTPVTPVAPVTPVTPTTPTTPTTPAIPATPTNPTTPTTPATPAAPTTPAMPSVPAKATSFTLSDLTVTPGTIKQGGEATVSVRVVNTGAAAGTKSVTIKIDGKEAGQKDITLSAGKSGEASLKISGLAAGNYTVSIENLSAMFEVSPDALPANPPSTPGVAQSPDLAIPILVIIAMGGLLVIVLVIILLTRRRA